MAKVLFWDFDGTLVKPNEQFSEEMHRLFNEKAYRISRKEMADFLGTIYSWKNPDILYPDRAGEGWWETFFERMEKLYDQMQVSQTDREDINTAFRKYILDFSRYQLYEDTVEVLKQCVELGYTNYLLSNNYPELEGALVYHGLSPYFKECFVSGVIGYEKPRPELFKLALDRAGNPDCCYMIGDNPVADILGGKAAGMKTILVHRDREYEEDYNCKTLAEIPGLLL